MHQAETTYRDRWDSTAVREQMTSVERQDLQRAVQQAAAKHTSQAQAAIIAKLITQSDEMDATSHGLHYFLHAIHPLLRAGHGKLPKIRSNGAVVYADGRDAIGLVTAHMVALKVSRGARQSGIALGLISNPGKVGALRVHCRGIVRQDQFAMIAKNTAPMVAAEELAQPTIGTNPICFGFPGGGFIFDSSTSTVATNVLRVHEKLQLSLPHPVGCDQLNEPTSDPKEILSKGLLFPFSHGPFWYKSFFMGVAVDALSALAGGRTGRDVGEAHGDRLYSKEGMIIIVIDSHVLPDYALAAARNKLLLDELREAGMRIPGETRRNPLRLLKVDWETLGRLL